MNNYDEANNPKSNITEHKDFDLSMLRFFSKTISSIFSKPPHHNYDAEIYLHRR